MIITIEGIDGAGKNTLVRALRERLDAEVIAFPRYTESIHAQLAADALHGKMGDLIDSAHGMATLFALDRAAVREDLLRFGPQGPERGRVLLLDRYVASNAAYTAARLRSPEAFEWVHDLEFGTLALPKPDLQVWLATPVALAATRATSRAASHSDRTLDAYESDASLQERTSAAYGQLAEQSWAGPWVVAESTVPAEEIADRIVSELQRTTQLGGSR